MARIELDEAVLKNVSGGNIGWNFVDKNEFYVKDNKGNILETYKAKNPSKIIEAFDAYYITGLKTEAEFIEYLKSENMI